MRRLAPLAALAAIVLALHPACRTPSSGRPDPASLPRNSFSWSPSQLEVGLANWDTVYRGREVPRGPQVKELPPGVPLAAFSAGGALEQELDRYMSEQRVAGLLVLHRGSVRLERYRLGYSAAGRWASHSVAKSVTSTLVGAAVKDGFVSSIDDAVTRYIPDLRGSAYEGVSVRHLMTMTSGVKWREDYTDPTSDIARFHSTRVTRGLNATVSYMRRLPREAEPGTKWVYKTGETHLLGVLVSSATRQPLADYLSAKIWSPYGMEQSASWSLDRSDHELAGCCLQAALRDYARFGQFVLDGGHVDDRPVVPDGWFEAATRTQVQIGPGRGYGYQWWTYDDGTFRALGIHGQLIHVDPPRRLVVAINSAWPEAWSRERALAQAQLMSTIAGVIDDAQSR